MANAYTPFSLSLYNCDVNSEAISIVLSRHANYPMLQELKYYINHLNQFEVKCLEQCLSHFKSIKSFTLSARYKLNSCSLDDMYPIQAFSITNLKIPAWPKTLKTILCNNKGIRHLTLCHCIGTAEIQVLAEHITHCNELRKLDISRNYLVDSDAEILTGSLKFCTRLKTIIIRYNRFSNEGVIALLQSLKHCSLVIHSRDIMRSNGVIIDSFKDCTHLQELHFTYTVSEWASIYFALHSKNWKDLHTLEFSKCLHNDATLEVSNGLKQLHSLQVLTISENDFSDEGAVKLAEGISHCTNLKVLKFRWNKNVTDIGITALAISLKKLKNLQEFNFSYSKHNYAELQPLATAITAVADSLQDLKNLQVLNLGYSKFGDKGAEALSGGITALNSLEKLRLGGNQITAIGSYPLVQSLRQCPNLIALDLRENTIGTDGSRIISACLIYWSNLQELNLSGDHKLPIIFENIDRQGVLALVENLHHCSQLTKLNLTFNLMGDEAAIKVAEKLRDYCPNLTHLYLHHNNITEEGREKIASCTKFWKNINTVHLF